MSNIKLTIIFVLVLVFIIPAILSLGIRYIPDGEVPQTGQSVKIFEGTKLEFNIENAKENPVGISVVVRNPQRSNGNLKLSIYSNDNNLLRESVVNGLSIPDGALVKFVFTPLTFKGSTFQGVFSSNANEKNAMEIYLEKDKSIPAFVSLYKPTSRLGLIINIYSSWLKRSFGLK